METENRNKADGVTALENKQLTPIPVVLKVHSCAPRRLSPTAQILQPAYNQHRISQKGGCQWWLAHVCCLPPVPPALSRCPGRIVYVHKMEVTECWDPAAYHVSLRGPLKFGQSNAGLANTPVLGRFDAVDIASFKGIPLSSIPAWLKHFRQRNVFGHGVLLDQRARNGSLYMAIRSVRCLRSSTSGRPDAGLQLTETGRPVTPRSVSGAPPDIYEAMVGLEVFPESCLSNAARNLVGKR